MGVKWLKGLEEHPPTILCKTREGNLINHSLWRSLLDSTLWIPDSGCYWILVIDSLPVEFAFRNPIVIGIPDSLLLPDRKAQDSGIPISLHWTKGVRKPS